MCENVLETPRGRVTVESAELSVKIQKLKRFMQGEEFKKLKPRMRKLMHRQVRLMQKYNHVLVERLTLWED